MRKIRSCTTCRKQIYFKPNSSGKWVPFDYASNKCHYATCTTPRNAGLSFQFSNSDNIELTEKETELLLRLKNMRPYSKYNGLKKTILHNTQQKRLL